MSSRHLISPFEITMMTHINPTPKVSFSNRIEVLYQHLKQDLFTKNTPFTKRMIIVASPAVKSWLMLQMARDPELQIAAGIDICFINSAISRLSTLLAQNHQSSPLFCEPSELELCLALEHEMLSILHNFDQLTEQEQTVWTPLASYLGAKKTTPSFDPNPAFFHKKPPINKESISKRTAKRTTALAAKLAHYFLDYGIFGGKFLDQWVHMPIEGWQQALWQRMERFFNSWNYPYRKYRSWVPQQCIQTATLQIHAFGLSYLAPIHHDFLMKAGQSVPLNYYLISPCQKFWTDLLSDKESSQLKAYWQKRGLKSDQQQNLDEYLRDNNALLANFGKLGRKMAQQIEESHMLSEERYALPATVLEHDGYAELLDHEPILYPAKYPLSILEALQADIALLRNPESSSKISFASYDNTVQIHASAKPLREVEAMYHAVLQILERHRDDEDPVLASDVIIMAPNIADYVPWIHTVFGSPESILDYQIMDLEMPAQNLFVQAFLHLLRLPLSRWDAPTLLRLFEYKAFQTKHRLSQEDLHMLRTWIKTSGIRWGQDNHHRNELLVRDHCRKDMSDDTGEGTWDKGLGILLNNLAMFSESHPTASSENSPLPSDHIEPTQGELLGRIIQLLSSLLEDLRPLHDGSAMTAKEWALYLKCLCTTYFSVSPEEDDQSGFQTLMQQITAFETMLPQLNLPVFAFHSIQRSLESALNKKSAHYRESHTHAVRFCSLLPMRSIPAKVLILMGLSEDAFPRESEQAQLNYLTHHPEADYKPSQIDFDRYLFLESLLSARRYFLLSYTSQDQGSAKECMPSLLVTELLSYMDKAYHIPESIVSQACIFKHAAFAFDKRYFDSENSRFKNYTLSNYIAAQSHYTTAKKKPHQFIPAFTYNTNSTENPLHEITVELQELIAFARNPLKTYFNKSLNVYLNKKEDRLVHGDEEMHLSHLNIALISRESLFSTVPNALLRASNMGKLPAGPFKEFGTEKIKKESDAIKNNLQSLNVSPDNLFIIDLNQRFPQPARVEQGWKTPSLTLRTPNGIDITIIGRLEMVSQEGLAIFGEDTMKDALKAWPALLTLCCLIEDYQLPIAPALLFLKGKTGKRKSANFNSPKELLGRYLDYFLQAHRFPSPLLPEWTLPFLAGNPEALQELLSKDVNDPFQTIYNDYLKWISRNSPDLNASSTMEHWQKTACDLFADLHTAWYLQPQKAMQGIDDAVL